MLILYTLIRLPLKEHFDLGLVYLSEYLGLIFRVNIIKLLTSISIDIRIFIYPKKLYSLRQMSLLRIDKSLCLPKLKSITVLLYDFSTTNENFLLSLLLLKACST